MGSEDVPTIVQPKDDVQPRVRARDAFTPGSLVAGRYRIIALLGRGGMGEVYRADDLKLGQQVALKFLPRRLAAHAEALERFYAEVRLGRQVSHPNVCRLYDIGEHEHHQFIAMEYVDGEDLATLLHRIGKLPSEKAIDIARGIAAGLAAAHDAGIVHRDLKPSNIMIDGNGRPKITDFGLASLAEESTSDGRIVGTPAYMAPEQLLGSAATVRSDLYAFGLIVHECLSGTSMFAGASADDVIRQRLKTRGVTPAPSTGDVDPRVERIVQRCLADDPEQRPASAHEVLAMLPGGDPLAAALAAGETPSPEMVAAVSASGELSAPVAWSLALTAILSLVFTLLIRDEALLIGRIDGVRAPEVLLERAQELAAPHGRAADSSWWFHWDTDHLAALRKNPPRDWQAALNARPAPARFVYRQSPQPMMALELEARVFDHDPPHTKPGMTTVVLDKRGRLLELIVVPAPAGSGGGAVDWRPLFAAAELPPGAFAPAAPAWRPPVASDQRFAWTGAMPESGVPIRVEAAAADGKPTWFAVVLPWRTGDPPTPVPVGSAILNVIVRAALLTVALLLARRNVRRGRGDMRSARKLALLVFVTFFGATLLRAHHPVADPSREWILLVRLCGEALFWAGVAFFSYLAVEPYVRRQWPHTLVSWMRLLNGRVRDAMVGRDVLIGLAAGFAAFLLFCVLCTMVGPESMPVQTPLSTFGGINHLGYFVLNYAGRGLVDPFATLVILLALRAMTRSNAVATVLLVLLTAATLLELIADAPLPIQLAWVLPTAALITLVLYKGGVVGLGTMYVSGHVLRFAPLTLSPSDWYFGRSAVVLAILLAAVIAAMVISRAGKPLFGKLALD